MMGDQDFDVFPARIFARPTAEDIWLGPSQREVLAGLLTANQVVLGAASSGKTTLLKHAASQLNGGVVLSLSGRADKARGLLEHLLQTARLSTCGLSKLEQRNLLSVFAARRRAQGRRVVVLVDDAEEIDAPGWEELARLAALRVDDRAALRFLLAFKGSEAEWRAACGAFSACRPSITLLRPLNDQDVAAYVAWRLSRRGLPELFTPMALRLIARSTEGRFGAIDVVCQMALLLMKREQAGHVDGPLIQEAALSLSALHRGAATTAQVPVRGRPAALPAGSLIATRDGEVLTKHPLGPRLLIGRSEHNDVCLPSAYLSRHHAVIVGTTDGYYVADLNSVNGLLINGKWVHRAILHDGDLMSMGPFRLKIELAPSQSGNPLPPSSSLDDTVIMPPQTMPHPAFRIVK